MNLFEQTLKEECIVQELFGSRARLDLFKEVFLAYERKHGILHEAYGISNVGLLPDIMEYILLEAMYDIKNRDEYVKNLKQLRKSQIMNWPPPDEAQAERIARQNEIDKKREARRYAGLPDEELNIDRTQPLSPSSISNDVPKTPEEQREYLQGRTGGAEAGVNKNAIDPEKADKFMEFLNDYPEIKDKFSDEDIQMLRNLSSNIFSKKTIRGITDPAEIAKMRMKTR